MKHILIVAFVLILQSFSLAQGKETLMIVWPEEYKWKVGSNQENESVHMLELIPGDEKIEKWTIIGTMMSIKGAKNIPMDKAMDLMFVQAKQNAPDATVTLVEKNDEGKHPWIIFKIESPEFKNDTIPESQLYYIIQGESALYSNFVALKKKKLADDFVKKWTEIFKASKFVNQ